MRHILSQLGDDLLRDRARQFTEFLDDEVRLSCFELPLP